MKKEDFKDIFNSTYIKSAEKIMERVDCCVGVACLSCPFDSHNNPKGFSCKDITEIGKYSTKYNLAKAFKSMVEEEKRKDFKVGNRVRVIVDNDLKNKTGVLVYINNHSAIVKFDDNSIENLTILFINLEKIEDKPFELKEGMKMVRKNSGEIYFYTQTVNEIIYATDEVQYEIYHFEKDMIDWEATRKLNEDYGLKADFIFIDEEPKKSFYVVYNEPNGQKKHSTYKEALEEAKSKFTKHPETKLCIMECKAEISGKIEIDVKELI